MHRFRRGVPQAVCGLPGGPFSLNRFARETRANHYAPLGARRRRGVGLLPQAVCGLSGGPFPLNRFARETRANRYAPLGARRSAGADGPAGAGGHVGWHRLYSLFNGGVVPHQGWPLFKCYRKKNQRGNDPTLVLSAYLPGSAGLICTAALAVLPVMAAGPSGPVALFGGSAIKYCN